MILQALYEYYQRKASDPESTIAPEGFEWKEIPFIVVIDRDGKFVTVEDTREGKDRNQRFKHFLIPKSIQRSGSKSHTITNLFWDHIGFVFGHPKSDSEKDIELAKNQHETWLNSLKKADAPLAKLPEVKAMNKFYQDNQIDQIRRHSFWQDCIRKNGTNVVFRINGESKPIPCSEAINEYVQEHLDSKPNIESDDEDDNDTEEGSVILRCLITGELEKIARKHTKTPINKDCKSLVGIQENSGYDSYGKIRAFNAPVSRKAEFAYTTALKDLLKKDSRNKVQVGDAITYIPQVNISLFEHLFSRAHHPTLASLVV